MVFRLSRNGLAKVFSHGVGENSDNFGEIVIHPQVVRLIWRTIAYGQNISLAASPSSPESPDAQ